MKGITDIHRDKIDHITIPSKQGKGQLKRIEEVFDCWFESGRFDFSIPLCAIRLHLTCCVGRVHSMPYAQLHYPFENKELFEKSFPANCIGEGIDQTRGGFYTLLVLSSYLCGKAPWQNVVVTGLVLAE